MNAFETQLGSMFSSFRELPYLFIGSGMSRRYYGLDNWENLLRHFADMAKPETTLAYEYYRNEVSSVPPEQKLPTIATLIEKDFNRAWLSDPIFAKERELFADSVKSGISPFKIAIANHVLARSQKTDDPHLLDEFSCLKIIAKRSVTGVITTNYDLLAEDVFAGYQVYVGQEELLFSGIQGITEIYKIHGCCQRPETIVISKSDYDEFHAKNAYLAAKLLTLFIEHPIIFLGYSISDPNIASILQAIVACLTTANLQKLQHRLVFIEYSPEPERQAEIRSHSLSFGGDRVLEMTKIVLHDYMPLYRTLLSKKYNYNPRLLRQLKRDIYQLVATNQPVDRFRLDDIEDDAAIDKLQTVIGVGVAPIEGGCATGGHTMPSVEQLFRDVLFNDGRFDLKSLVESALIVLLKGHSNSLPVHKYIAAYRDKFGNEPPMDLITRAKMRFDDFFSKGLLKARKTTPHPAESIQEIKDTVDLEMEEAVRRILLIEEDNWRVNELEAFLKSAIENRDILNAPNSPEKTNFKRLIRIYDWLKYGKKEGRPKAALENAGVPTT